MTSITLVESRGGRCRLRAVGEFDRDNCDQFAAAVRVALARYCRDIVLDLAEVTFIDAATARALLSCREAAARRGCGFWLLNETGVAARVLEMTGAKAEPVGIAELNPSSPGGRR